MKLFNKIYRDVEKYIFGTSEFSYLDNANNDIYPIDLSFTLEDESFYYSPKDQEGIPYTVYASVSNQYNPTRVAAYGLAHFNQFILDGKQESKENFFKSVNWFMSKQSARFEYLFDWEDLRAPWISCMAQGEATSLLVRAFKLTEDERYLLHAKKSLDPLFSKIELGGVQSKLTDGSVFLEEYPSKYSSNVLNGFMYALIGLSEFVDVSGSVKHRLLLEELIQSLINNIQVWSMGKWSLYDNPSLARGKNFCTPSYHNLQITQLTWLANRVESSEIKSVINLWRNGLNSSSERLNALFGKVCYRLRNKAQR